MKKDDLLEDIYLATETTQRAWKAMFHEFIGKENISPAQAFALFTLENRQPINHKDFAVQMQLTPGAVTQLIDGLGEYIERKTDDKDRRIVYLTVSKKGLRFMQGLRQKRKALFKQAMGTFTEKELELMLRQQQKVLAQIESL
jgi:DNA-binding MarR family transcriptional regulator